MWQQKLSQKDKCEGLFGLSVERWCVLITTDVYESWETDGKPGTRDGVRIKRSRRRQRPVSRSRSVGDKR